jgi:membrane protease YdiL (CAAX protease family)
MSRQETVQTVPPASAIVEWIRRFPILSFILLTFVISWLFWLIPYALGVIDPIIFRHLNTIGAFGPAIAALILSRVLNPSEPAPAWQTRLEMFVLSFIGIGALYLICLPYASNLPLQSGIAGWSVRIFLFAIAALVLSSLLSGPPAWKRLLFPSAGTRPHPAWYAAAILVFPLILLAGIALNSLFGQTSQFILADGGLVRILATFVYILLFGGPLNEESGWRGFMLPQLQHRFTPLISTLIIGLVWGVWHFPMHVNGFYPSAGPAFLVEELALRVLSTLLVAFLYTWFYNKTKGSVLVCILLHAGFNTASIFISTTSTTIILLGCLAAYLVWQARMWKPLETA